MVKFVFLLRANNICLLRKFKINQDTLDWSIMQLEDELDATDEQIVQNNLGLVASFGVETYRIDLGLLNIIKKAVSY